MTLFITEKPILSIGDACPDVVLPYGETRLALAALARGESLLGEQKSPTITAGGSVGNTAHGIAVLGGISWFAGKVGNDYFGHFLKDEFLKAGVDTRLLVLDNTIPTSLVIAVLDSDNSRTTYVVPRTGASQHLLRPEELPEGLVGEIGWLHTSGILLREDPAAATVLGLMEKCRQESIPVSLDLNYRIEAVGSPGYQERIERGIALSTILFGSGGDEFMPVTGAASSQEAALALGGSDRVVVCRNGAHGSEVYLPDRSFHHCDAFDVPVIDTLGAGDAFNAGFITAAAQGLPLEEANRWGNAVAGYKIMHSGARNFPDRRQLDNLLITKRSKS